MHVDPSVQIAHFSLVGVEDGTGKTGSIASDVRIGSFCHIALSSQLEERVTVDHYCQIGALTQIGHDTQVLYNAQIFAKVRIGNYCVIAGEIPNRVVVEDYVTFMGRVAHSYRDPTKPWDTIEEPSPTVKTRSVVGVGALLVGPVTIGPRSYVAAGEVVRHDVPPDTVLYKGHLTPLEQWRGVVKVRSGQGLG